METAWVAGRISCPAGECVPHFASLFSFSVVLSKAREEESFTSAFVDAFTMALKMAIFFRFFFRFPEVMGEDALKWVKDVSRERYRVVSLLAVRCFSDGREQMEEIEPGTPLPSSASSLSPSWSTFVFRSFTTSGRTWWGSFASCFAVGTDVGEEVAMIGMTARPRCVCVCDGTREEKNFYKQPAHATTTTTTTKNRR